MNPHPCKPRKPHQVSSGILVFGCGYLGQCVAKNAILSGQKVWGTTRRDAQADVLSGQGIEPVLADWNRPSTLRSLPAADRVLISVSYDPQCGLNREHAVLGGLNNLLESLPRKSQICYISTTGVYHQSDGSWVNEQSPAQPVRPGGKVHLQAERMVLQQRPLSAVILRLSGIYGPGRLPRLADLQAHRPLAVNPDHYLNLIHVEDAAQTVAASWDRSRESLYLVSDDLPVKRGDFYRHLSTIYELPEPIFTTSSSAHPDRIRFASNKRICNRRMKEHLVNNLSYPNFRLGIPDSV